MSIHLLLLPSQFPLILALLMIIFVVVDRQIAYQTLLLVALCLIVNVALKVTFQVPLAASIGKKGFAFPSGHMQFSTVFYGWLAYQIANQWLRLVIGLVLIGVGYGLVAAGYHTVADVLGGAVVGGLLVVGFAGLLKKFPEQTFWMIVSLASVLMIYIPIRHTPIPVHAWGAAAVIFIAVICQWQNTRGSKRAKRTKR